MDVLVIGGGGREHALVWALDADPDVTQVHAAPGNPGISGLATCHDVDVTDHDAVVALARDLAVDLVVVGPEAPLVAGLADDLRAAGISCFGPGADAARIEGSKAFAKDVMAAAAVPTGRAYVCLTDADAERALDAFGPPHVVKDDGLAGGKGVLVTDDRDAALEHARGCDRVVIEEFLAGPELSLFAITDGTTVLPFVPAQDSKRVGDGDIGPNTGGMGSYAPLPWVDAALIADTHARVLQPVVDHLRRQGTPFVGLLYAGLVLTDRGIRVIEFNARFGDPETQALLRLLDTPLGGLLAAAAEGTLDRVEPLHWRSGSAVTVVLASAGYPGAPRIGDPITGIPDGSGSDEVVVFHAGTATQGGEVVSAGGRVLNVTAVGADLDAARAGAYEAMARIELADGHYRRDIGDPSRMPKATVGD